MAKASKMEVTATAQAEPRKPTDLGELLIRFQRIISNKRRRWRFCAEPHCRRERTCVGQNPQLCSDDGRPKPARTPEQDAKIMADLYKDLKRLSAEKQAQAETAALAAAASQPAAPPRAASKRPRRDSGRASR